ncbi:MAG: hypothetical protein V7641_5266, partial [Blastocatellia bacterium]
SNTAFPAACCGGTGTITITTTFTEGDNNIFGPFTRTVVCSLALGARAPVVFSVTPSNGNCAVPQDVLITGACFIINGVPNVTSVFAIDRATGARINASQFFIVNANLIDAFFNFGSANNGHSFLIFVSGPNGTSRNRLVADPACTFGNEQGVIVTFTCNATPPVVCPPGTPGCPPLPQDVPVVNGCRLDRQANGSFTLEVFGANIKAGATATVGGVTPKKIKFIEFESGSTTTFRTIRLVKKVCGGLPGDIKVTNPGTNGPVTSAAFFCNERCPAN